MELADGLIERLGVDGQHPAIADAAAMVTSAYRTRDMETIRFACQEFEAAVRGLAAERTKSARLLPTATKASGGKP
jgi:hypothetical protein